ncbi:MAG: RNA 2',3'-cyclic phosphodiesterase [Anaerolineales bacterium]|nr:RNA 2',3'-cyclic phosphodiesterase [Anaerolineales bacterium]
MSLLRAFIAIEFPKHTRDAVAQQTAQLRQTLGNDIIRWVPPENMHLTLKFIGEVAASHLSFLKQMISHAADSYPQFDLQLSGLGSYPATRPPRVLWIGIHAPNILIALQKDIEAGAARLGYEPEERPFAPHLTLGRTRQNANPAELPKIRAALNAIQLGKIDTAQIDSVHLFKSDLNPGGSIYTKLFSAPLKADSRIP